MALIDDNYSTNRTTADKIKQRRLVCSIYRSQLAVKDIISESRNVVEDTQTL